LKYRSKSLCSCASTLASLKDFSFWHFYDSAVEADEGRYGQLRTSHLNDLPYTPAPGQLPAPVPSASHQLQMSQPQAMAAPRTQQAQKALPEWAAPDTGNCPGLNPTTGPGFITDVCICINL
jgi:hypothetical protein